MTQDQMELLCDMISDKVFNNLIRYFKEHDTVISFNDTTPEEFFQKHMDPFGVPSHINQNQKDLLAEQLVKLSVTREKLLAEEKYELLEELTELYNKIKKEYDQL